MAKFKSIPSSAMVNNVVPDRVEIWEEHDQSFAVETFSRQAKTRRNFFGPSPTVEPYLPLWSGSRKRSIGMLTLKDGIYVHRVCSNYC